MPIPLPTGNIAETVTETETVTVTTVEVTTELSSDQQLNVTVLQPQLADFYEVKPSAIKITPKDSARRHLLTATRRRLQPEYEYTVTVTTDPANAENLTQAVNITASELSAVGGYTVTQTNAVATDHVQNTTRNVTRQIQVECPPGSWCTAGTVVPWCAVGVERLHLRPLPRGHRAPGCSRVRTRP